MCVFLSKPPDLGIKTNGRIGMMQPFVYVEPPDIIPADGSIGVILEQLFLVAACAVRYDDGIYHRFVAVTFVEFLCDGFNKVVIKRILDEVHGAATEAAAHDT